MITRKNRKQSLKVREMKEIEEQLDSDSDRDRKRLVRIFLETWLEAKQQLISNGGGFDNPNETIHEAISRKLVAKGYNISSKLALNKTGTFFKKYQFVRQCEQEGKKIEWANYDIVKKIFELSEPNHEPTVVIPITNIKNEDELTIVEEEMPGVDEKKSDDGSSKVLIAPNPVKDVTPKSKINSIKSEDDDVELVTGSNCSSEASDLDDDLDFENPLDSITLRLPDSSSTNSNSYQNTSTSLMPPPNKRIKRDSTDAKPVPSLLQNDANKTQKIPSFIQQLKREPVKPAVPKTMPLTIPGLKPGEFLIPAGATKPGQKQQFFVVKRLPNETNGTVNSSTSNPAVQNGKEIKLGNVQAPGSIQAPISTIGPNKYLPSLRKVANSPPLQPSPVNSPFILSNTPSPPLHVPTKPIQIPMPTILHGQSGQVDQETKLLLTQLIDSVKGIEKERLEIERKRYESELEHQKEMIQIFKDIRDKFCDIKKD